MINHSRSGERRTGRRNILSLIPSLNVVALLMSCRLNWSPDGQQLVSAHAMNNCGSVAQIIDREGWTASRDFVGHRKAVTCVRFNPLMYRKKKDSKSGSKESG